MVERKKNAIGIRCHNIGKAEKELYLFVSEYFGKENTFFVMNVDPSKVKVPEGFNHIIFNHDTILSSEKLFWPQDVAWKCGDYCHYAMFNALSGYAYFWLVEPDIKFCCDKAETFFEDFETQEADFLAPKFGKAYEKLPFYPTAKVLESEPMTCLFGITRMNPALIPKLLVTRENLSEKFYKENLPPSLYPNDEIFISTVGARMGLRCAPMDKISTFNFLMFSVDPNTYFLEQDLSNIKGKFVVHPLMDEETFMNKKMRRFDGLLNNSYPLLDFMAQTINKCSDEILQKRLKDQFRKRLDDFVSGL